MSGRSRKPRAIRSGTDAGDAAERGLRGLRAVSRRRGVALARQRAASPVAFLSAQLATDCAARRHPGRDLVERVERLIEAPFCDVEPREQTRGTARRARGSRMLDGLVERRRPACAAARSAPVEASRAPRYARASTLAGSGRSSTQSAEASAKRARASDRSPDSYASSPMASRNSGRGPSRWTVAARRRPSRVDSPAANDRPGAEECVQAGSAHSSRLFSARSATPGDQFARRGVVGNVEPRFRSNDQRGGDLEVEIPLTGLRDRAVQFALRIAVAARIPEVLSGVLGRDDFEIPVSQFAKHRQGVLDVAETLVWRAAVFDQDRADVGLNLRRSGLIAECLVPRLAVLIEREGAGAGTELSYVDPRSMSISGSRTMFPAFLAAASACSNRVAAS